MKKSKSPEIIRVILAIGLGLAMIFHPVASQTLLEKLFGWLALIGGTIMYIESYRKRFTYNLWYFWILEGMVHWTAGLFLLAYPSISLSGFLLVLGLWAFAMGMLLLGHYLTLRNSRRNNNNMLIRSILSFLAGILIIFSPFDTDVATTVFLGAFILLYGISSGVVLLKVTK